MKSFLRPSSRGRRLGWPDLVTLVLAPLGIVLAALWTRAFARLFLPRSVKQGM